MNFVNFGRKKKTSVSEEEALRKKNVNLKTIIFYGLVISVSITIWFLLYDTIKNSNEANLYITILTTLIVSGVTGLITTWILNEEKNKALDASIERVRKAFWDEHFVCETIDESLKRGFEYCDNKVGKFKVYAVSTKKIVPFVETRKDNIHINTCQLMVRGYGENVSRDDVAADNEITSLINSWKALEHGCIKELKCVRYDDYSLNYYCIFDDKFITFGQYIVNEDMGNKYKVEFLRPFSITNKTEVGQQIIENSIKQFDSYFNSKKKNE
jgi:hypothetical protein